MIYSYRFRIATVCTMSTNRRIYEFWMTIQDIIGNARLWPISIRRYFWTPNLRFFHRTLVAAFVYVNGLMPEIFMEWARLLHLCRDQAAYRHFEQLFSAFEHRRYNLYAYNVTNNRYEYIEGRVRVYVNKGKR